MAEEVPLDFGQRPALVLDLRDSVGAAQSRALMIRQGKGSVQTIEITDIPSAIANISERLELIPKEFSRSTSSLTPKQWSEQLNARFQTPAFSPKWTLRFGGQYGFDLGGAGSITLGAQSRYKSRTALAVDNTYIVYGSFVDPGVGTTEEIDGLFQKGYWLHDARIVYETTDKHWAVGLYGNNLTDRAYKTDAQEFSNIGGIRTVYYGAPRTVTLRLTARY